MKKWFYRKSRRAEASFKIPDRKDKTNTHIRETVYELLPSMVTAKLTMAVVE
jgi:hypothetical protein